MNTRLLIEGGSDVWSKTAESVDGVVVTYTPETTDTLAVYYTRKTFDDGVPCVKYFRRDRQLATYTFTAGKPVRMVVDDRGNAYWTQGNNTWFTDAFFDVDYVDSEDFDVKESEHLCLARLGSDRSLHAIAIDHGTVALNPIDTPHGFDYEEE
jgi:hypothetical protein